MKTLFDKVIDIEIHYTDESEHLRPTFAIPTVNPLLNIPQPTSLLKVTEQQKKSLKIKCPKSGKKPEISFEWSRVPEAVCYECSLRVTNLYLNVNVAWVDEIIITAGYASDFGINSCTFRGSVFNSYTPEPGPDGYTVFDMLVAKAESSIFSRTYTFTLYNNPREWQVGGVLDSVCRKMTCKFVSRLSSDLFNAVYSKESLSIFGKTGYALINDIQERLNALVSSKGNYVKSLLFDDTIVFAEFNKEGKCVADETKVGRDVPQLTLISSADWNAGTLTITAPWVPSITPGSLFYCYPQYFKGSAALPNEVARQQLQRDNNDMYYVITQHVKFSTTKENEMQIMAVPMNNSPAAGENLELNTQASNLAVSTEAMFDNASAALAKNTTTHIQLGEQEPDAQVQKLDNFTLTLAGGQAYKIVDHDTLSAIAERFPPLKVTLRGESDARTFPASVCWFPVIMCLTNTKMKMKNPVFPYKINMSDPDSIQIGKYLELPVGITWKQISQTAKSQVVQCMRLAADYYEQELVDKKNYAGQLRNAAHYLENGVVVE